MAIIPPDWRLRTITDVPFCAPCWIEGQIRDLGRHAGEGGGIALDAGAQIAPEASTASGKRSSCRRMS
jgi:hypothetical protein